MELGEALGLPSAEALFGGDPTFFGRSRPSYPFGIDTCTDCVHSTVPFDAPRTLGMWSSGCSLRMRLMLRWLLAMLGNLAGTDGRRSRSEVCTI